MQAAVLSGPGQLQVREVPTPACPDHGVLVKVRSCGICSADIKMADQGHPALVYPRIPGHEISGEVAQSTCLEFEPGDRVQVAPGLRCGGCFHCLSSADNQCLHREIFGFTQDGGFAEYLAVPLQDGPLQGRVTPLPQEVSFELATLAEPIACCLNAFSKISLQGGENVVIVGAGPLGLLNGLIARSQGAGRIFFSEISEVRRRKVLEFPLNRAVDPQKEGLSRMVMDETGGKGADLLILACSGARLDTEMLRMMSRGGRISLFSGIGEGFSDLQFDLNRIHYQELALSGAYGCTADQNSQAVDFIARNRDLVQGLISHKSSLSYVEGALKEAKSENNLKTILEMDNEQ